MFGRPVATINTDEGAAYGAALLAAVGAGEFRDIQEACAAAIRVVGETPPNRSARRHYDRAFGEYRQLYRSLRDDFQRIAVLGEQKSGFGSEKWNFRRHFAGSYCTTAQSSACRITGCGESRFIAIGGGFVQYAVFLTQVFIFQEVRPVSQLFFHFMTQVVGWQEVVAASDRAENELGVINGDLEHVLGRFLGI